MDNPVTVKELFALLGERLYDFESKRYIKNESTFYDSLGDEYYKSHDKIITEIGKLANKFNPKEVYDEAKAYEGRITAILDSLEPVEYEIVEHEHDALQDKNGIRPTSPERKLVLMERYKRELTEYLKGLKGIMLARQQSQNNSTVPEQAKPQIQNIQQAVIQLPENFTVTQLNKHFDPQLSVNQAALFLHYLQEQAILPPYSGSSIGKLAEAFFVRNQKNVTKSLTDIHSLKQNKEELSALKRVVESLLKTIETDLKKAR